MKLCYCSSIISDSSLTNWKRKENQSTNSCKLSNSGEMKSPIIFLSTPIFPKSLKESPSRLVPCTLCKNRHTKTPDRLRQTSSNKSVMQLKFQLTIVSTIPTTSTNSKLSNYNNSLIQKLKHCHSSSVKMNAQGFKLSLVN